MTTSSKEIARLAASIDLGAFQLGQDIEVLNDAFETDFEEPTTLGDCVSVGLKVQAIMRVRMAKEIITEVEKTNV